MRFLSAVALVLFALSTTRAEDKYWDISDLKVAKPEDKEDVKSTPSPKGALVLFDGKTLDNWTKTDGKSAAAWKLLDGGIAQVNGTGNIITKEKFDGHFKMHVEFRVPYMPKASGQGRGNSGVYVMGLYEIQILDSYNNDTYYDGQAASIYKQHPPMVNACRKPGEWQTYDIIWEGPRFDRQGKLLKPALVTVLQNGVVVQNHFELSGATSFVEKPHYTPHPSKMPMGLQYHGNPVRFRNIWVREIKDIVGKPGNHPHHPG